MSMHPRRRRGALRPRLQGADETCTAIRAAARSTRRARSAGSSSRSPTSAGCRRTASAAAASACCRGRRRLDTVVRTDEPTTLALAEVDDDGVARYRFYERGTSAPGADDRGPRWPRCPANVEMLHVGTLGLALEPIATALEAVVERLAERALIAVDPNCRPWVIDDHEALPRAACGECSRTATWSRSARRTSSWLEPGLPRRRGRARAARAGADRGPAHARRRTARWSSRAPPRSRCRRRAPRSSTRSAPATRSAAASWAGGSERGLGARRARPRSTSCGGDALRLPGRRAHVLAARRVAAVPERALGELPEPAHRLVLHAGGREPDRGDGRGRVPPPRPRRPLHQLRRRARRARRRRPRRAGDGLGGLQLLDPAQGRGDRASRRARRSRPR